MNLILAGRNTEREEEYNTAEQMLTECGHNVYSVSGAMDDREYVRASLTLVDASDALVVLDAWQQDPAAILQSEYALYMGKMLFDFNQFKADYMKNNGWKN